ncbi:cytochrome P450 [Amycolatopsis sp. NBRC 101858]|uniref:cytochrome P450 family protein n=1 Tax=Amycolatopsis sp. NBRC 101858 TaxID=3032200 RepID=UPI0024A45EBC|nr:cytochrome P450 [Amycolatopsis sp. NBRC 101858]GLY34225.1 cytochrome P450 [Amycolatopsis sp. NBRC 101858]
MTSGNVLRLDVTGQDVHGEGRLLRAEGQAGLVELPGGVPAWAVADAATLRKLLTDPRVSKDPRAHWTALREGRIGEDWPLLIWVSVRNMFTTYGADHRRLRALVSKAFTVRQVEAMRPDVEQITTELLDRLERAGGEPVDLREEFAYPLPVEVICRLFGVPADRRAAVRSVVDTIFDTTVTAERAQANSLELYELMRGLVADKTANPAGDLTSALITARAEDTTRLDADELVDTLILMLTAGHETTVNLLDHAVTALLTHPDQLAAVLRGDHTWAEVIEETLRWQAPVPYLPLRYAIEDIALDDGTIIAKGEAILAAYAAAGRDPAEHGETAGEFDLSREDKQHLAFGHGVHFCMGAPLARLEAAIALPALFARFPGLRLAVDPAELTTVPSFLSNGHTAIPALLGAGKPVT